MTLHYNKNILAICIALAISASYIGSVNAADESQEENTMSNVELGTLRVTGQGVADTAKTENTESYTAGTMNTATKLDLSIRETPQSVSVMTRTQMDDFGLNTLNDVLTNTSSINVNRVETDRTTYNSRGFEINNFLVDGLGLPITGDIAEGEIDTAIYDRIEILRGSNAILTGIGNPSATINQIRKRPTSEYQASASASLGSWNNKRLETDLSGAITENKSVRGRLVVVQENGDSYLDRHSHVRSVLYGIVDMDISERSILTVGFSEQQDDVDGSMSGGLPMFYDDGSPTDYDVSVSSAPEWALWDTKDSRAFIELSTQMSDEWKGKVVYTRIENTSDTEQMYLWWQNGVQQADQLGSTVYLGSFDSDRTQNIFDVYATGPFNLAGREHELVVGASLEKSDYESEGRYSNDFSAFPYDLATWDGFYPKSEFVNYRGGDDTIDTQKSVYATGKFNISDRFKFITGARVSNWETSGEGFFGDDISTAHNNVVTPNVGLVFDVSGYVTAYGSYSESFIPQDERDSSGNRLDPQEGTNYEVGVKGDFNEGALSAALALYNTQNDNVAEEDLSTGLPDDFIGVDGINTKGVEFDISGEIIKGLQASAGITKLKIEDSDGNNARTYIPRKSLRASAVYKIPSVEELKIGASVNWQSEIYRNESRDPATFVNSIKTTQDAYKIISLMAKYDFSEMISLTFNANNITNEKYLSSLQYEQSYYGEPRNYYMTFRWKY